MKELQAGWYWVQFYNGSGWRPEYYSEIDKGFIIDNVVFPTDEVYDFDYEMIVRQK